MREQDIKDYLEGKQDPAQLKKAMTGMVERTEDELLRSEDIEGLEGEFEIRGTHLLRVLEHAVGGQLSPEDLSNLACVLVNSDGFSWNDEGNEGEIIGEILYDWSAPETNFPLTKENLEKYIVWLQTGEQPEFSL